MGHPAPTVFVCVLNKRKSTVLGEGEPMGMETETRQNDDI